MRETTRGVTRQSADRKAGVPSRRGLLAGGTAVAAVGGADLFIGQQRAAAAVARATGDVATVRQAAAVTQADVVMLMPSGDASGSTDAAAINAALSSALPGGLVWLGPGTWHINEPVNMPPMRVLRGTRGGVAGSDTPGSATVITPVPGFSSPYPVTAAIVINGVTGVQLTDLSVSGSGLSGSA